MSTHHGFKHWLRQRWYGVRDRFRDRVWAFAGWIDPAVGAEHGARALAMEDLQRFAAAGMPVDRRMVFLVLSSPREIAEAALRRADRAGFYGFDAPTREDDWSRTPGDEILDPNNDCGASG